MKDIAALANRDKVNMKRNLKIVTILLILSVTNTSNAQIPQNAFGQINAYGQVLITKPGLYVFPHRWHANLKRSNLPAISISAPNVILNLDGKSLNLSSTSHTPVNAGIELAPGVEHVTITNGTINGTSTHTAMPIGITGIDNTKIKLSNLTITGCNEAGIDFTCSNRLTMQSITVRNTVNHLGNAIGIKLSGCKKVSIHSSSCKTTRGGLTTTDFVAGIYAENCEHCFFDQISASHNKSATTSAYGLFLQSCKEIVCSNVNANHNKSKNSSSTGAGFLIVNSDANTLTRCHANANVSTTTASARGFIIQDSSGNFLHRCVATGNAAPWGTSMGFDNRTSKYTYMHSCRAYSNKGKNSSFGFSSDASSGTHIINAKAIGNTAANGFAAGIRFINEQNSTVRHCEVLANNATLGSAFGIALFEECFGTKVSHNFISKNLGPKQFGFYDEATYFTNFLRGNISLNHGLTVGSCLRLLNSNATNYYMPHFHGNVAALVQEVHTLGFFSLRNQIINLSVNTASTSQLHPKQVLTRSFNTNLDKEET